LVLNPAFGLSPRPLRLRERQVFSFITIKLQKTISRKERKENRKDKENLYLRYKSFEKQFSRRDAEIAEKIIKLKN
jgi:hypothetical protein